MAVTLTGQILSLLPRVIDGRLTCMVNDQGVVAQTMCREQVTLTDLILAGQDLKTYRLLGFPFMALLDIHMLTGTMPACSEPTICIHTDGLQTSAFLSNVYSCSIELKVAYQPVPEDMLVVTSGLNVTLELTFAEFRQLFVNAPRRLIAISASPMRGIVINGHTVASCNARISRQRYVRRYFKRFAKGANLAPVMPEDGGVTLIIKDGLPLEVRYSFGTASRLSFHLSPVAE